MEQGDGEAVRVCECLYGIFKTEKSKEKKRKKKETKKKHRDATFERSRPDTVDNEEPVRSNIKMTTSKQRDTAARTSGSEKVKPCACTALGREAGNRSKVSAAGWLCTTHRRHTLTYVFRHLRENTVSD